MLLGACIIFAVLGVSSGEVVAFTAGYDRDTQLQTGEIFVPNKVLINHGGGYNISTGVFTAPKSGIYVFQFYTLSAITSISYISLYHNDVYVISAWAHQALDHDAAGNSAILRLQKTDRVYLKAPYDGSIYNRPDTIYTTFSGFSIALSADCDFV